MTRDRRVPLMRLKPEALRFERQRTAAGERVVEPWQGRRVEQLRRPRMTGVRPAGPPPALPNLLPRLLQELLVRRVLPLDQLPEHPEQPFPLPVLILLRGERLRRGRRVVHHLREEDRPRRRQRPPRPPQVQRRRVPVPDRLLPRRRRVDRFKRQRRLDQLPGSSHPRFAAHSGSSSGSTTVRKRKRRKSVSRVQMRCIPCSRVRKAA